MNPLLHQLRREIQGECDEQVNLRSRTTIQTGGRAEYFVLPRTAEDLEAVARISKSHRLPLTILGKGSNLLIADEGIPGIVIQLCEGDFVRLERQEQNQIVAGCGVSKARLLEFAINESLSGLEFSMGIPGDLGGALRMNAGTKYGCYAERLISVTLFDPDTEEFETISNAKERSSYREQTYIGKKIVTEVRLQLETGNQEHMKRETARIMAERASKQPLEWPNFGSAFKNPDHSLSAGRMIEQCGLKGLTIGGAQVSTKHANFIVNINAATSTDILQLLCHIQGEVHRRFSVWLEPEVRLVGSFPYVPPLEPVADPHIPSRLILEC